MLPLTDRSPRVFRTGAVIVKAVASFLMALCALSACLNLSAQVSVLTQNADNGRDAVYSNETVLTPTSTIHKQFTISLDDPVKGQALILGGVNVPGAPTNILLAATSPNESGGASSAWAFNADTGAKLWQLSLGTSAAFSTATPVIDPAAGPHGAMFVLTETSINQLHAIDAIAGTELPGSPITIAATAAGQSFDSGQQNDRAALLEFNGVVYASFAHQTDSGAYHGWVIGYQYTGSGFTQTGVFCDTCAGGSEGGIWQGGDGPVSDGTNIYVGTGNGTVGGGSYGMSVVQLNPSSLGTVLNSFVPPNAQANSNADLDLNGGGMVLMPGSGGKFFLGPTKYGALYLLNSANLAQGAIQSYSANGGVGHSPIAWNSGTAQYAYVWPSSSAIQQFCYNSGSGSFSGTGPCQQSSFSSSGTLAISSTPSGSDAILWAFGGGELHAMNPANVAAGDYWNSNMTSTDSPGSGPGGFQYLAIANGKVYVPAGSNIVVYSASGGTTCTPPTAPSGLAATAISAGQIGLTWTAGTSSCAATYSVFRSTTSGFTPSSSNQIASSVGTTSYTDSTVADATTYYYLVEENNSSGVSGPSNQASATTPAPGPQVLTIDSGSTTEVSPFVADTEFTGGTTIDHANTIDLSHVTNPAPMAVYQSARIGNFSYTLPGFTPGTNYMIRLHFAETYFTTAGSRVFSVSINGVQVLTDFDIVAASGGINIAIIEQFLEPANASGDFVIAFTSVVNNSLISGVEVDTVSTTCPAPTTPSGLTATAVSSSQINLTWTASSSSCAGITYDVFRSTTSGFAPSSSNQIANGLAVTAHSDTGLAASTAYYYLVEAVNPGGTSAASGQASAVTEAGTSGEGPYGGTAAAIPGTVLAEKYDTGGQGVGYNITSTNGTDNGFRSDGVDLETTTAPGGGNDIGWTAAGQWFRYTVNVATAGTYTVTFEIASPAGVTDGLHLSNSAGTNLTGSINVPKTGGWQTWTTVTASVTLPAGQQVLTWNQDNGGYNLDSFAFTSSSGGGGATFATGTPYNIVNENSGSCVSATGSGTTNGTTVEQYACAGGTDSSETSQQWEFMNGTATGYYEVINVHAPAEAWNVTGNGATNGSLMQLWTYAGSPNEEWMPVSLGNGYYKFVGQGSGLCLDTPGDSTANSLQYDIFTCNGTEAQAFQLVTP
jgi:hypothetical protein